MSSKVTSGGIIAAAVLLPVAAAYGAGWMAWQGGKLLVEAGQAVNREVALKKKQLEAASMHRKRMALAARTQLVDMCTQILSELEGNHSAGGVSDFEEIERLKLEINQICQQNVPEDAERIESQNALGFSQLESIIGRQRKIGTMKLMDSSKNLYRGQSVADIMEDFRIAVLSSKIQATKGRDISIADPVVLERAKLNDKFALVVGRIMAALEHVDQITNTYGLTDAASSWFHSCFNGVDIQIKELCKPTTTNEKLKKGIKRLEEIMEQYDMMIPSIEKERVEFHLLYGVYADAAEALGETVINRREFKTIEELENKLEELKERANRAQECAEIYKKLGYSAYLCYAWDQELKALGYTVHSRKDINELINVKPEYARIDEVKIPFYQWNGQDLTQLYSVAELCDLQVIVHEDGAVSMQTMSKYDADSMIREEQKSHCQKMQRLYENLARNWFVLYNYEEISSADEVTSMKEWFVSDKNEWRKQAGTGSDRFISEQRQKDIHSEHRMQTK